MQTRSLRQGILEELVRQEATAPERAVELIAVRHSLAAFIVAGLWLVGPGSTSTGCDVAHRFG